MNSLDFSHEDVERARRYHRPRYAAVAVAFAFTAAAYAALAWSPPGRALWHLVDGLGWAGSAAAWAAIVVVVAELVQLPLSWWRGLDRERRWGFSTQSTLDWLADRAKGLGVGIFVTAAAWTAAVALARAFPGWWPLAVAPVLAAGVLLLSYIAPVVLEPLFNRFGPLEDAQLAADLRALGQAAGVPIRDVLVADTSRRTTKVNAYVSGLGATCRIVLSDTLLGAAGAPEVKLIVAHELGHRRDRHVVKGTLLACQAIGARMADKGRGSIVNLSSIYGMLSPVQELYDFRRAGGETFFKPIAYSVSVKDGAGLPVRNVQVHWAVGPARGSMNPVTSATDSNGIAVSTRRLGTVAGTDTATASVGALTVRFTATTLPGAAAQIFKQSADPQSGTVATAVTAPLVKVVDQFANAVSGVIVDFVVAGGGALGVTKDTSDAAGLATTGSWTLDTIAGSGNNRVQVSAPGVASVTFSASGIAGAPAQLAFLIPPSRSVAGDTIAPPVRVAVEDRYGNIDSTAKNPVRLDFGKAAPGGTLSGINPVAASRGIAVFPDLAIDSANDPLGVGYTLLATSVNLTGVESNAFDIGGVIKAFTSDRLRPVAAAFNPKNGLVYVPGTNNSLGVLDPFKGPISQLQILPDSAFGVAVNAQTNRVYVTTFGLAGAVVVIDASNNSPILTIPLAGPGRGVAVDEAADRIYVAVAGDTVKRTPPSLAIIDGKDPRVIATIPFREGGQAAGVAFNPKNRLVYVAIPDLGVGVFDPATLAHVATLPIVGVKGAAGTYGVVVDVPANLVYATNRAEHTFSVIDPVGLMELDRISVGALPEGLGVDRGTAYVANSGTNTVSFIHQDPKTGRYVVFATLIVGPAPKAAAVNPLTGHVYVPTFSDDHVRVIQP